MLPALRIASRRVPAVRRSAAFQAARAASTWANVPQGPPDVRSLSRFQTIILITMLIELFYRPFWVCCPPNAEFFLFAATRFIPQTKLPVMPMTQPLNNNDNKRETMHNCDNESVDMFIQVLPRPSRLTPSTRRSTWVSYFPMCLQSSTFSGPPVYMIITLTQPYSRCRRLP